jgi:signal transduction histidine kinase/ligand-binding sensor domain-containing protein
MTTFSAPVKAILVALILPLAVLVNFFAQTPSPSPSGSPQPSPSASPSPSPARAPSPTPLPGAQNFHQWGSVTVFNGLPSDSVRAIAQTIDGVMWFGTDNGLARFDGRRVQNLSPGGPDTNGILSLAATRTGELWVGTRAGAFVYSGNRFDPVAGTRDYGITSILLSETVVLGTDAGLVLRTASDGTGAMTAAAMFTEPIKAADGSVVSITGLIKRNGIYSASTSGHGVVDIVDGRASESPIKSRMPLVHAIATSEDGTVWLGTEAAKGVSGVYASIDNAAPARIAAPTADVFSLETNDGGIWAGTERYGLFHFVGAKLKKNYTFENTSGGLRSNTIFTIFTDREGVVWIGTNRGVSRFDRLGAAQETVSDIPNSNFVRALFPRGEEVLAGTNRGLFVSTEDSWRPVPGFDNRVVFALAAQKNGATLVGTATGLFDLTGRLISPGDVRSFANFQTRTYAAVFGRGVVQLTNGDGGVQVISPDGSATSVCEGADRLWIGTNGVGLFSYDGRSVKKELEPDVLKSGTIWKMFSARDASLWIAGQHGVFRVRDGEPERIVEMEDVRDVYVEGDEFWAATTVRGLLHGRNYPRFGWVVSAVGFEQGLPSEKAFSIIRTEDEFMIATNRGVVSYKPGSIPPKIIPTRVLSQRVHDLSELTSTIALDYPQNSLIVEVAGQSSRTFPEEFQYAFILTNSKGDEVARQLSNDPQYAPADLAAGDYTIESTAFNRDLLPSEPLFIRFSVAKAPFPWTATALAGLLFLALVGLVWAVVEHRRIKQRNRELAAARFDLANEAERERRRIARDLHDQTLADLRTLMIKSDKMDGGRNAEFRNEIEAVSTEIRRICEDLSPSVLENVGLVAALEFLLDNTVENRRFTAAEGLEDRIDFSLNTQLQIYRIAQEVLSIIVRHSDADLVEMNVEATDGQFSLTVRDNGGSFQPDRTQKGRGISNIRSRANLINGRVSWKESGQAGNIFWLRVDGPPNGGS